jgi:hypothetical protein
MDTGRGLHHLYQEIIMDTTLAPTLVALYALGLGFIVGWFFPRGRILKAVQLRLLRGLHNFFADEEQYVQKKVAKIRKTTKRN